MTDSLSSEIVDQPQNQCQYDRDDYAACQRHIHFPITAAKFNVAQQFKDTQLAKQYKHRPHRHHQKADAYEPFAKLFCTEFHNTPLTHGHAALLAMQPVILSPR